MAFSNTHRKPDALRLPENHFERHAYIRHPTPHRPICYGSSLPFLFYFDQGTFPTDQFRPMLTPPHYSLLKESKCKDIRSLPDDVLDEILARLPVKTILKLRSVCTFWYFHTQEQRFIQRHMQMNKPNADELGIIAALNRPKERKLLIQYFVNGVHEFDITPLYEECFYEISNSCDGLICIYGLRTTYLMNPSIKEVVVLPPVKNGYAISTVALVKIASTAEYKIVRTYRHENPTRTIFEVFCEVFDGSTYSWRPCRESLPLPHHWVLNPVPVVINGVIHWVASPSFDKNIVISYDVGTETVNVIKEPEGFPDRFKSFISLVDFDGCLCIAASVRRHYSYESPYCMELWVLKDYKNLIWEKICIQAADVEHIVYACNFSPIVVRNGRILWYASDSGVFGVFAFYDIKKSGFISFSYEKEQYHNMSAYNESLISPATILVRNQG